MAVCSRSSRCSERATTTPASSVAITVTTSAPISERIRKPDTDANASPLCSEITSFQSVPATGTAVSNRALPSIVTSVSSAPRAATAAGVSAGLRLAASLSTRSRCVCTITLPLLDSTKASLDGVGLMAVTAAATTSMNTSPAATARISLPLRSAMAKVITSFLLSEST